MKTVNKLVLSIGLVFLVQNANAQLAPVNVNRPEMRPETTRFLKCFRTHFQSLNYEKQNEGEKQKITDEGYAFLRKARSILLSGAVADMAELANQCEVNTVLPTVASNNSTVDKQMYEILSGLVMPTTVICKGWDFRARVAAIIGPNVGLEKQVCTFTDGSRRLYFGPNLGLNVPAIGVSVAVTSIETDQPAGKVGSIYTYDLDDSTGGPSLDVLAGVDLANYDGGDGGGQMQQEQAVPGSFTTVTGKSKHGVGIFYGGVHGIVASIKLLRLKDDFDSIFTKLETGIIPPVKYEAPETKIKLVEGKYRTPDGDIYFYNGTDLFCKYDSFVAYKAAGGTGSDFTDISATPAGLTNIPSCK